MHNTDSKTLPWYFFAAAFQSLIAIIALGRIPSEGTSLARLALYGTLSLILFITIGLGLHTHRNHTRLEKHFTTPVILSTALLSLTFGLFLFLLRYLNPERFLPYYERLSPLLWLLFFLTLEATLLLLYLKNGFHPQVLATQIPTYRAAGIPFIIFLFIFLFIAITKIGITPDTGYWGEPGVAIPAWQFIVALMLGFATLLLSTSQTSTFTRYLPFILYALGAILWLSVPLETLASSFYAPITPPANIPFPYSDAGFYDYLAQSILIGSDYLGNIPPRPLYVLFLTILHAIFGQNYPAIITAQTLVLALFPIALYFLAKEIHTHAAGVTVALFAIFREYTSLWVASNIRVSNVRMFTTDFTTAFGIVLLCLILIWWLKQKDLHSTLIAGGSFGLLLLIRTQSTLVLPVLFLLILFSLRFKWIEWIKLGLVFAIAMVLTVLPWLTHNYTILGKFTFDNPQQLATIYSQYSLTGNLDLSQFNPETDSVRERIIKFTLENPSYVANFFTAHFLNTQIGGVLALPLIKPFYGFQAPHNLYWVEWNGTLEWYNQFLVLFYLMTAALGIASAWRKANWLALIPLAFNLGYALANAIARFSSWRYNLPIDWVFYFYFAIGSAELLTALPHLFGFPIIQEPFLAASTPPPTKKQFSTSMRSMTPILIFMFVGTLPWLAKGLVQPLYTSTPEDLLTQLEAEGYNRTELEEFLTQPQALLLEGSIMYPRMYWRGEGLSSTNPWPVYAIQDFPRIGFLIINSQRWDMLFPTRELINFPQGAKAVVLACAQGNVYTARLIAFENTAYQNGPLTEPCP